VNAPEAVFLSYRLGGDDGVAVEAAKWEWALHELGFDTRRVAGELERALRPDDTWLPFLAIDPTPGSEPDASALAAAIAGADLVIVENLCSLPLNLDAASIARDVLDDHTGRVCFHHHDFAWERAALAAIRGFPPDRPNSLHVTISEHARRELTERGIAARTIHNSFVFGRPLGERITTRAALGFDEADIVLLQPTRAIPRKNVAGGIEYAERLADRVAPRAVRYWITGPAEDGYDDAFERIVDRADVPVHVGRAGRADDAYAAADLIVFSSTWEGFGNPVIEAVAAHRMVVVGWYPVLDEIVEGLDLLSLDDVDGAAEWLRRADMETLQANERAARARFDVDHLPDRLRDAFSAVGWTSW
jgi:glycosyltransferase involved in cell wall biosynthesis